MNYMLNVIWMGLQSSGVARNELLALGGRLLASGRVARCKAFREVNSKLRSLCCPALHKTQYYVCRSTRTCSTCPACWSRRRANGEPQACGWLLLAAPYSP